MSNGGDVDRERQLEIALDAARTGDVAVLSRVLESQPEASRENWAHRPLIEVAVREGQLEAVRLLLDAGAAPDQTSYYGDTLIQMATDRGHEAVAELLAAASARSARVKPADGPTDHPIHAAAEFGQLRRVRALIDADQALVHRADRSGGTPLHRAVIGRARKAVALLLDRGADIDAVHGAGMGSCTGYAPEDLQAIDLAIWGGPNTIRLNWRTLRESVHWWFRSRRGRGARTVHDRETARLLIARGAAHDLTIAAALGDHDRVVAILDRDPAAIASARPNGRRPLSAAAEFGHDRIVRTLLDRGADPTWPDADGSPRGAALHAAARYGRRALVELLLARGADPNGYVNASGNATFAARTPEIRALLTAHGGKVDPYDLVWLDDDEAVMRAILADPASADAGCGGVFTAVCTRGKRKLLHRLLDAGIRVPPLADGCQSYLLERPDMLRTLLEHGALSPDYANAEGITLLHLLCSRDVRGRTMNHRPACGALLLDAGAAIAPRDREFRSTPLAWAARNNLEDMVVFLLGRGAPVRLADDQPWATPLAWAERRGHARIAGILRQHGAA